MQWKHIAMGVAGTAVAVSGRPLVDSPCTPSNGTTGGNGTGTIDSMIPTQFLIGKPNTILLAQFDGKDITVLANSTISGTTPSWMAVGYPRQDIYAVDESSDQLRHFTYDSTTKSFFLRSVVRCAPGLVHLAFDRSGHLVGSSYASGLVDVFNLTSSGAPVHFKNVTWSGTPGPHEFQTQSRSHQAVLDTSGRFFAVPDIGSDDIVIIDTRNDKFDVVNTIPMPKSGCGPRHGVFVNLKRRTSGGTAWLDRIFNTRAELYVVVCEYANTVEVFDVGYNNATITMTHAQSLSTFGEGAPAPEFTREGPYAGAIELSHDNKHIYVSNRLTGNKSDSVVHYTVENQTAGADDCTGNATPRLRLKYAGAVDSLGIRPRAIGNSFRDDYFYVSNQGGENGVVVLRRDPASGELRLPAAATMPNDNSGASDGPQFIMKL